MTTRLTEFKDTELHQAAYDAAMEVWGRYVAEPDTWDNMCQWLVGWYFGKGFRVKVSWDHHQTHRAILKVIDLDAPILSITIGSV